MRTSRHLVRVIRALVYDDRGQDLVEYVLLVALIGLAAVVAAPLIEQAIATGYSNYNTNIQDQWEIRDPLGS
jgi:Flp pilus assembly pilin Flp